ncbi:hypothetical protein ACR8G9_22580, partial [Salmonella enterica subsp. enterica serovar Paratyphi A]
IVLTSPCHIKGFNKEREKQTNTNLFQHTLAQQHQAPQTQCFRNHATLSDPSSQCQPTYKTKDN